VVGIRNGVVRRAGASWKVRAEDLDGSFAPWLALSAAQMSQAQRLAARRSVAYLSAFTASELGHLIRTPAIDLSSYTGASSDGQPLETALLSPLIGAKAQIGEGIPVEKAIANARVRALRAIGFGVDQAARRALSAAMDQSAHVEGWRRALAGTCEACMGLADGSTLPAGTPLECHPYCECVSEPVIAGVPDRFPQPTGHQLFTAMGAARQVAQFGEERAKLLRDGDVTLGEMVDRSPQARQEDFITAKPLADLPGQQNRRDAGEGGRDGRGNDHHNG
jgi:hypothetical protein